MGFRQEIEGRERVPGVQRQPFISQQNERAPSGLTSAERAELVAFDKEQAQFGVDEIPEPQKPEEAQAEERGFGEEVMRKFGAFGQGVLKGYQNLGNTAIEAADLAEDFLRERGIGDDIDDNFLAENKLTFATDPSNVMQPEGGFENLLSGLGQLAGVGGAFGAAVKGVRAVGRTTRFLKATSLGAATDFAAFDPDEGRLTDLLARTPFLQKFAIPFLTSNPKDTRFEARFKNALEGVLLGGVIEGALSSSKLIAAVMAKFKAYRAARVAKNIAKDTEELVRAADFEGLPIPKEGDELVEETLKPFDKLKKKIKARRETQQPIKAEEVLSEGEVRINTMLKDMQDIKKKGAKELEGKVRTVMSDGEARRLADLSGLTDEQVKNLPLGSILNKPDRIKVADLMEESLNNVFKNFDDVSKEFSPVNQGKLLDSLTGHVELSNAAIATGSETGLALPVSPIKMTKAQRRRQLKELIKVHGGNKGMDTILASLAEIVGEPSLMGKVVAKSLGRNIKDVFKEVVVNKLLGAGTQIYNFGTNVAQTGAFIAETGATELSARIIPTSAPKFSSAVAGETRATALGIMRSVNTALKAAKKTMVTGKSQFPRSTKFEFEFQRAIEPEAFGIGPDSNILYKGISWIGTTFNMNTKLLESSDEFFKVVLSEGEKAKQAFRAGFIEQGKNGLTDVQTRKFVDDFLKAGKADSAALAIAKEFTGTTELKNLDFKFGKLSAKKIDVLVKGAPLSNFVSPFTKFNLNQVDFILRRNPITLALSRDFKGLNGALKRDEAIGKFGVSSMALMAGGLAATQGIMTGAGSGDKNAERTLRDVGENADILTLTNPFTGNPVEFELSRLGPFGEILTIGASLAEIAGSIFGREDRQRYSRALSEMIGVVASLYTPEFLVRNFGEFLELLGDPEPRKVEAFAGNMARIVSPIGTVGTFADPIMREARPDPNSPLPELDRIRRTFIAGTPGLSKTLPAKRDILGRVRKVKFGSFASDPEGEGIIDDGRETPFIKEVKRLNLTGLNVPVLGDPEANTGKFSKYY